MTQLVERSAAVSKLHAHITPGEYSWIGTSSGVRGLNLNYTVTQEECAAELYIDRGKDSEVRTLPIFLQLEANKADIEKVFGGPLSWERLDGKRACRIRFIQVGRRLSLARREVAGDSEQHHPGDEPFGTGITALSEDAKTEFITLERWRTAQKFRAQSVQALLLECRIAVPLTVYLWRWKTCTSFPGTKPEDNSAPNLIVLCANCHTRADAEKWPKSTLRNTSRFRARLQLMPCRSCLPNRK